MTRRARQAVEKAIKAVLASRGIVPPRRHNLGMPTDLLPDDCSPPQRLTDTVGLSDYGVGGR